MESSHQPEDGGSGFTNAWTMYRHGWLVFGAVFAVIGSTGLLVVSPPAFCGTFLAFAAVGAVVSFLAPGKWWAQPTPRARRVAKGALILATAGTGFVGLALGLGVGAVLLLLVIAASSPYTLSAYGRWIRNDPGASAAVLAAWAPGVPWPAPDWRSPLPGPDLQRMSTQDLCQAWCASYLVLSERSGEQGTKAVLAAVEERQRYLDELERRNPEGLAAWLAVDGRVASNPASYLTERRTYGPGINWEELTEP